ncbi:MAG: phosphate ABC transporter substrate-binding protein [Actinomycetota bacterium]
MHKNRSPVLWLVLPTVLLAVFFASALTGCSQNGTKQTQVSTPQTIRITGSSTCLPMLKILTTQYAKKHPEIRFLYLPSAHSGAGIQGAANGTLDIGAVSRDLTPEEIALGLEYIVLSNDGLAIATHKDMKIKTITTEQLRQIYSGEVVNWKDLGGPDASIVVLDRAEDESAKVILRKYLLGDTVVLPSASVMFLETDLIKALTTTPDSIGYLSLGAIVSDNLDVNVLSLDDVQPSVLNIHSGLYKIVRPLGIVLKKNPTSATRSFVEWVHSAEGTKAMDAKGYASVK